MQDSIMAVELDDRYIKAFATMGQALVELGKQEVGSYAMIDKGI